MIEITDNTTVREVASAVPASVRVFQQFGIDFCCGGGKTLAEACQEKGIAVEQILSGVNDARQRTGVHTAPNWSNENLATLIDHILAKHHEFLRTEMPRLGSMVAKVIDAHGAAHGDSLRPLGKIYSGLHRELDEHMWKEENVLFPLIKQLELALGQPGMRPPGMPIGGPIQMMEFEHESAGNALRQMRQVTSDYQLPQDACATYRALFDGLKEMESDLHEHIHLENNILFPRALKLG